MPKKPETIRAVQYSDQIVPPKRAIVIPDRPDAPTSQNLRKVVWTGHETFLEVREKLALEHLLDKEKKKLRPAKTGVHFVQGGLPE